MEEAPEEGHRSRIEPDAVEQVVAGDRRHRDRTDDRPGQVDERRQDDHRPAEDPEDDAEQKLRPGEEDKEVVPGLLEDDEPQAAREQVAGQLASRPTDSPERGADAGEQAERGGAEVRHPSGVEEGRGRRGQVRRIEPAIAEEVAAVIQHHQDHHRAAEQVHRFDAGPVRGRRGAPFDRRGHEARHGGLPGVADVIGDRWQRGTRT